MAIRPEENHPIKAAGGDIRKAIAESEARLKMWMVINGVFVVAGVTILDRIGC